jgi:hypothetical protein
MPTAFDHARHDIRCRYAPADSHFGTRNFIVNIQQLQFENPGLYSVDMSLDDQTQEASRCW